jgi:tetratricopeptide (TPR) repeat protein
MSISNNCKLLLLLVLSFKNVNAQQNAIECIDKIEYQLIKRRATLEIKNQKIQFGLENLGDQYTPQIEIECLENGFDLIITGQLGNEYSIYHYIFEKRGNEYFTNKVYYIASNRQDYGLQGAFFKTISFYNFNGIFEDYNFKSISYSDGFQEGFGVSHINYYKLIENAYKKNNRNDVKLFTDPFVITKESVFDILNEEQLNNIGYYAFKMSAYDNARNILEKVIKNFPNRTVAYLNLADTYYALNLINQAKENYQIYISKMNEHDKESSKIPKRVFERSK